jgi:hypothetical protein
MSESLLPQRFLFRFSVPCQYRHPLWKAGGAGLDERYRLASLAELDEQPAFAEISAAWNEAGLVFATNVHGKKQPIWCRATRPEDSDSLQIWIDTRDVRNVHRASRFCHRFLFLPSGGGRKQDEAFGQTLPINRAREPARPVAAGLLQAVGKVRSDGYRLECFIPAEAMLGFEPGEHPRIGFTYALIDRELGQQTFSVGPPLPYDEDPSLWATLELVGKGTGEPGA